LLLFGFFQNLMAFVLLAKEFLSLEFTDIATE